MPPYKLGQGPYGSAYQGTVSDLFGSGDLQPIEAAGRTFGLFLGQFDWTQTLMQYHQTPKRGIWAWLFNWRHDWQYEEAIPQVQDIRFTGDQHHLVMATTGTGKFTDVLSNMLLYDGSCETACLIIDPKGEIASKIGPMIDAPGQPDARTIILDPWNVTGAGHTDSYTLLDGIRASNKHVIKDARVLADAIIVQRSADEGHWVETAKNFLTALLLFIGINPSEEGERTLFRLREIITSSREDFQATIEYMRVLDICDGVVARAATAFTNKEAKERNYIISTIERDTTFIDDTNLWPAIKTSSFDMNRLVLSNKRVHVIIPFDYLKDMTSWLRLNIAAFYNACLRLQLPSNLPKYLQFRHIIIDEFAGLGKMDFIVKDIAEARGAGVKYHLFIQNIGQLDFLYGKGWTSIIANSFVQAFGVDDNETADYLSKMTGQATVVTESTGYTETYTSGTSHTYGSSISSTWAYKNSTYTKGTSNSNTYNSSTAHGTSTTFASAGRPVLMPDEIRRISRHQQLLFLRGMPVFLARRTPYYETFKAFLPKHSLRQVLSGRHPAWGTKGNFLPFGGDPAAKGRLISANAVMRGPRRLVPPYRGNSFLRALAGSYATFGVIMLAVVFAGVYYSWSRQPSEHVFVGNFEDFDKDFAASLNTEFQRYRDYLFNHYDGTNYIRNITYQCTHLNVISAEKANQFLYDAKIGGTPAQGCNSTLDVPENAKSDGRMRIIMTKALTYGDDGKAKEFSLSLANANDDNRVFYRARLSN